ncbi:MAG: hypothetical protein GTO29_08200 [Candidatus Latescibacteria bacterium]|nr:hypothetical protein [Candidatus Latescibacterota bacterium]NIO56143.1 hypothetical protein [Candidatus Latescibacterota bacterium]
MTIKSKKTATQALNQQILDELRAKGGLPDAVDLYHDREQRLKLEKELHERKWTLEEVEQILQETKDDPKAQAVWREVFQESNARGDLNMFIK